MKKQIYLIIIIQLILLQNLYCNEVKTDSLTINTNETSDDGIDLILIGGVGLIPKTSMFGQYFDQSPALTYGLEIPFTESRNWSFQLHGHFWISRIVNSTQKEIPFYELSNKKYSQTSISTSLKWYIFNIDDKFKMSIHWGYLFGLLKDRYEGPELGLNLYYRFDDNFSMSIGYKNITKVHFFFILPDGSPLIDLFTLEIYFDYNMRLF